MVRKKLKSWNRGFSFWFAPISLIDMKYPAKKLISLAFVILIWISFSSCDEQGTGTIDDNYLSTKEYNQFARQADQEQTKSKKQKRSLTAKLGQMNQCPAALRKTVPLEIQKSSFGEQQSVSQSRTTSKAGYNLTLIACVSVDDLGIRWIVREWPSIYVHSELLMATYKNGDLISHEVVGLFRDNLSENISTNIDVKTANNGLVVLAKMDRNIRYPIEQHNTVQTIYHINMEGNIAFEK